VATAIVAGALANKPRNGGEAWVRLSWLLGLRRLGFEVWFVERLAAAACVDAAGRACEYAESINREHFESVLTQFALDGRAALIGEDEECVAGLGGDRLAEVAAEADVLFNLSGHLPSGPVLAAARRRVYVDLDPGFTQAWHADPALPFEIEGHDHHVTVGLNVGRRGCEVPDDGLEWLPTLPPVVLEEWPVATPAPGGLRFTTVATWRSPYGSLSIGGTQAGLKHHEFRRLRALPLQLEEAAFELALDIHPADRADLESLREGGWRIVSPTEVAATPGAFRDYLRGSGAEFSVAQGVYVASRSGWFSDRTAAYLACGRPAVVQDTGLGARLPVGEGLLTFSNPEQARAATRSVAADPQPHREAARRFAERHLDSDRVLGRLLEAIGMG
jgi:hypothetical protein